jgi:hypothetical protein
MRVTDDDFISRRHFCLGCLGASGFVVRQCSIALTQRLARQ